MRFSPTIGKPRLGDIIGYVLATGVVISLAFEIVGIFVFENFFGSLNISERKEIFIHGRSFFNFITGLFHRGYGQKDGILLMTLGITILILTPYIRVILSVLYFAWKKNIKYTIITLFVFVLLTLSLSRV